MSAWRDPAPKRHLGPMAAAAFACVLAASPARAEAGTWLSAGVLAGTTRFDAHLADYQWDLSPRAAWGAEVLAGSGPLAGGVRVWRSGSQQQLALDGVPNPDVAATSVELVARARVARPLGVDVSLAGGAGRLVLGFSPDRLVLPTSGGGAPIEVTLAPVHEWTGTAGVALERAIAGPWRAGLNVERRMFGLDTAHRAGTTVVMKRESFGEWSARFSLARVFALNGKGR